MDVAVVLLTLVAAILIGYILGKQTAASGRHAQQQAQTADSHAEAAETARRAKAGDADASSRGKEGAPPSLSLSPLDSVPLVAMTPHEGAFVHALATPPTMSRESSPRTASAAGLPAWPPVSTTSAAAASAEAAAAAPAAPDTPSSTSGSTPTDSRRQSDADSGRSGRASKRVVIVAKQLPLATRRDKATGKWTIEWEDNRSFLSGLRCLRARGLDVKWVGVPNTCGEVLSKDEQDDYEELLLEHDCVPVFLLPSLADKFFNQFCKGVLWPMLHYVLPQSNQQFSARWDELWQAYTAANALFASVVSHCVDTPTDTIWLHNYHLLLLPSFLRTKLPRAKIGLFIHTPFPSSDVFRVLPTRHNILSSIMAADLLGFHTFDYARHFLSCTKRVMDLDFETLAGGSLGIKYNGRFVSILISHVGIDSAMFLEQLKAQPVMDLITSLRAKYGSRKIVVGAGDLDSVKGGLLKFQAYDRFLSRYGNQWKDKMVFVEVLLPNRSMNLDHTQDMGTLLKREVESIHARYGKECFDLLELPTTMPLRDTVALFAVSDVCIASQFWDGLNLLPFEYTASQLPESPGALVISEFMGCSRTLNGVIRVNPWSLDAVANALHAALSMTLEERQANHLRRYTYVLNHTIDRWAVTFLEHLDRATKLCEGMNYVQVGWGSNVKLMGLRSDFTHLDEENVTATYRKAERRVLLLDYDGTLTPPEKSSVTARSRLVGPTKLVKKLLLALSSDKDNIVFIMSGRTRSTLSEWFPASEFPDLGLAAEKGLFLRWPERLAHQCRQDLRQDPALRRRVIDRKYERQQSRDAALHESASQTSETRSQAFIEQAALRAAQVRSGGPAGGDAHLLVEEVVSHVDDTEWEYMIGLDDVSWKAPALEIIRSYTEQTDGSWIEDKEFAIVWHYEQADPEYGRMQASELQKYLLKILGNPAVDVVRYDYNRILEVKPHGVSKGLAATAIMEELFKMHKERLRASRPASPTHAAGLSNINEQDVPDNVASTTSIGRGNRGSMTNLAALGASPPHSPVLRARSAMPVLNAAGPLATTPPFVFCVGDDRSDEDMFLSVQNKDYLEGRLRPAPYAHAGLVHMHSAHGTGPGGLLPPSAELLKRSMSAVAPHAHHSRNSSSTGKASTPADKNRHVELDEKTARERRKNRIADPFTYTVCVGMKPSNAHYYLHDDEEVIRLLQAMATSSQRMAQTRAADKQALIRAAELPPTIVPVGAAGSRPVGTADLAVAAPRNPWLLRPTDIPTTPPVATGSTQAQYLLQQAAAELQQQRVQQAAQVHAQQAQFTSLSSAATARPRAASMSESEDEAGDDDDDADDSDSDGEFASKPVRSAVAAGGGGLRRM